MPVVPCPSCGQPVNVPEKKTGLWWGIGCLIAALGIPVVLAVIGLLAAIAIPSFVRARETSQYNACLINLRMMESAKDQLALDKEYDSGQSVSESDLAPYLSVDMSRMICPAGGTYSINEIGEEPECSMHGSKSNPKDRR